MTFSFLFSDLASADPATQNRAIIRSKLGDTRDAGHVLENEEIDYQLGAHSNDLQAALYECWKVGLAFFSKQTDTSGAGIQISRSQRFTQWKDLGERIQAGVTAGLEGVTIVDSDLDAIRDADTFVEPDFSVGMDRYPGR